MRVTEGIYVLPIPRGPQEAGSFLNLTLVVDEEEGATLVDAGLPAQGGGNRLRLGQGRRRGAGPEAHDLHPPGPRPHRFGSRTRAPERREGVGSSRRCSLHRRRAEAAQGHTPDARTEAADARGLGAPRTRPGGRVPGGRKPTRPGWRDTGYLHAGTHAGPPEPLLGAAEGLGGGRRAYGGGGSPERPEPVGYP